MAAYKAVDLVRRLSENGASVTVIMTEASQQFIPPLSLQVASGRQVYTSLFQDPLSHISLPAAADLLVVAPATANIIGKFANGIADDMLSTLYLSYRGPVIIAPAMNWKMYEHPAVQENLKKLRAIGVRDIGPDCGALACGEEGKGRLADVHDIVEAAIAAVTPQDLEGLRVVVTAGPTREFIDPVRFLSNRSSGKMGYCLARAACRRGAVVTLISGPTSLSSPNGITFRQVETAGEMLRAVEEESANADLLVMAAAVADFRPAEQFATKGEKAQMTAVKLRPTEDIISRIAARKKRPAIIGFAAETGRRIGKAKQKMVRKGMDMIVFNDVTEKGAGFETETNNVTIVDSTGTARSGLRSKDEIADFILDRHLKIKT